MCETEVMIPLQIICLKEIIALWKCTVHVKSACLVPSLWLLDKLEKNKMFTISYDSHREGNYAHALYINVAFPYCNDFASNPAFKLLLIG